MIKISQPDVNYESIKSFSKPRIDKSLSSHTSNHIPKSTMLNCKFKTASETEMASKGL